jgi:hypothetical protein
LPRSCSALLMLGLAIKVWVSRLDIEERIRR